MIQVFNEKAFALVTDISVNDNMRSIIQGLQRAEPNLWMCPPHRLVPYLAQVGHESGSFRYDREVWGPTPAQKRYDTRTDLGNTAAVDGDGFKFRGRTGIQITGRHNTCAFRDWCRKLNPDAPDFEQYPDLMNTDPWEGLGPLWYWDARDLNRFCDDGNFEALTRYINGGLNGYDDRCRRYTSYALRFLGYSAQMQNPIHLFQFDQGLKVDGVAGPKTRKRLHECLVELPPVAFMEALVPLPIFNEPRMTPPSWLSRLLSLFSRA